MQISTHILDTSSGSPAGGVAVRLEIKSSSAGSPDAWKDLGAGITNPDGRHVFDPDAQKGVYRLTFSIEDYFKRAGKEYFFMNTPVVFKIEDTQRKYHVPLLLNPFGYSTYRGS